MEEGLQKQKQAVVRDALYDSAIDLFAKNGFDETTVEEVAQLAGLSRRTFFRYFTSKDDLLAHALVNYTRALEQAVRECSSDSSPLQVMTAVVLAAATFTERSESRTREAIEISRRSASARQAYLSRMVDIEDGLDRALEKHFKRASRKHLRTRLMASITLTVMNATIAAWYQEEYGDVTKAASDILNDVQSLFCDRPPAGSLTGKRFLSKALPSGGKVKKKTPAKRTR